MTVHVDVQRAIPLDEPEDALIQKWVESALKGKRDDAELTIRIVDEVESAELNQTYRHKQGATNVLSFPFEAPADVPMDLLGDLVICAPVVEQQAVEQTKSTEAHWAHMVVHGTLHLLGYDHIEEQQAEEMESLEISILDTMGFPNPYKEENEKQ